MENCLLGIKMKILVIGSEGYLGSRLVPYLSSIGYYVDGIDAGYYSKIKFSKDYNSLSNFDLYDTIILLAGHSSPTLCENDPVGSYKNNVTNFIRLLEKLNKNQRLLYASSASVCNGLQNAKEDDILNDPISNYDLQKQIIEVQAILSEKETVGMRFGTVGGYSLNPRLDSIINSVYKDGYLKNNITINNFNNLRSFLGMTDMCRAVAALIELPNPEKIYNIASGTKTINEIASIVAGITHSTITFEGGDSKYSFGVNTDRINSVVTMRDTIESICEDMGDMAEKPRSIYNRNTNLFKYELHPTT